MKKITIIGAGIGGLTTAIALIQKGFEVEIFENAPAFKKAGSGINLAINAMQVYKRLGLYEEIFRKGNYTNKMCARKSNLDVLTVANLKSFEQQYGVKTVAIHRAVLHNILLKHIGNTKIHLNKKLKKLEQKNDKVQLYFDDGSTHQAEIVIGADGLHSKVRQSLFANSEIRDAEQICWRGISKAKIDGEFREELNELWGKGSRFGFVRISEDEIYWFGLINKKKQHDMNVNIQDIFSSYHSTVHKIILKTPKEDIICNEIWDLKPLDKWYDKNVCLIGDAAHATTPNMGQGACQAVESALAFSLCLSEEEDLEKAFAKYQKKRIAKANSITKMSWAMGKIAQTNNPVLALMRNIFAKATPELVSKKQNEKLFKLNY